MIHSAYLQIIIAAILWGSTGVFVKLLNLPPTTIGSFRLAIPAIVLFLFLLYKKRKFQGLKDFSMLLASTLNAFRLLFYFVGFSFTSIGNAVISLYTWPIFSTILSIVFLKEKVPKRNIFLLVVSFIGIVICYSDKVISLNNSEFLGMLSMTFSAFLYATTIIIFKKKSPYYSKSETIFYQNFIGAVVFLPFLFLNTPYPSLQQFSVASLYAVLTGLVSFSLFFSALKKIKTSSISLLSYIEVISAILLGFVFLDETLSLNTIMGGLVILISTSLIKHKSTH